MTSEPTAYHSLCNTATYLGKSPVLYERCCHNQSKRDRMATRTGNPCYINVGTHAVTFRMTTQINIPTTSGIPNTSEGVSPRFRSPSHSVDDDFYFIRPSLLDIIKKKRRILLYQRRKSCTSI